MNQSKSSTTKYYLLNPTKEKIIVSAFDSLVILLIFLFIPSFGFKAVFLNRELTRQIFSIFVSVLFSVVIYYPLACGLVYIILCAFRKEIFTLKNIFIALIFIIIFNPITLSVIATNLITKISPSTPPTNSVGDLNTNEQTCGLQIEEVIAPTAKNSGLVVGEVIKTINGFPVQDMGDLAHALAKKRPNDTVEVVTNINTHNVTLFANPQDPAQALLGIKVNPSGCKSTP